MAYETNFLKLNIKLRSKGIVSIKQEWDTIKKEHRDTISPPPKEKALLEM